MSGRAAPAPVTSAEPAAPPSPGRAVGQRPLGLSLTRLAPARLASLAPDSILDECEPFFDLLIGKSSPLQATVGAVDAQSLYTTLAEQLASVRAAARANGLNHAEVEAVAFALAAFADEQVMSSKWPGRSQWPFLQYTEFGKHRAGEEFFELLAQHRQGTAGTEPRNGNGRNGNGHNGNGHNGTAAAPLARPAADDPGAWGDHARSAVLEVYYLCLMLGFQGKYAVSQSDQYQHELARMRSHIQSRPLPALGPVGFPPRFDAPSLHVHRWRWPALGTLLMAALLSLLVFVALNLDASRRETPPVISSVAARSVTNSQATIIWETDKRASSQVEYGRTDDYGTDFEDRALVKEHSVALIGLLPNTTYHFRVSSTDAAGNQATSIDATFTTAP